MGYLGRITHAGGLPQGHDNIRGSQRAAAKAEGLLRYPVTHALRPDLHGTVRLHLDQRTAAEADGHQVRHPEVGADVADFHRDHGLSGETVAQYPHISGRAATSTTKAFFFSVRKDAPRMLLVGPQAMVRMGYRFA